MNPPDPFQDLDLLADSLDLAGSEARLRALLPVAHDLPEKGRSHTIELLALIARFEAAQNRLPEAHVTLKQAEELLNEEGAAYHVSARIRWMLERGRLHILDKTPSQANILFSEAWSLANNSGEDFFVVDIALMMAAIGNPKAQEEWIRRGIEIAEGSPVAKTKRWLGGLYMALGWKLYDVRQFDRSLETFQKAMSHLKAQNTDREVFIARWAIGKVLRTLGKTEEALAIQRALLAELGIGGRRDGRLYEELAECLQAQNRAPEAQLYFELAYRELASDAWVTDNQPVRLKRMKDLGKVKL